MRKVNKHLWAEDDRPRQWKAYLRPGDSAQLRHHAVLTPGEDLTEYPPTVELSWPEWLDSHTDYGLTADGRALEVQAPEVRAT